MAFYSEAPAARPFSEDKPTLIMSWWITIFCVSVILVRLSGRMVRVEKLLREDVIMAFALIPLVMRAVCVQFVITDGTNNLQLDGLSTDDIAKRVMGSRYVLGSRIFYPATLWLIKLATLEFYARIVSATSRKSYIRLTVITRWFLVLSFFGVVTSTLVECRPVSHYWQVSPDPGPQCRQGVLQLLTMGVASALTDVALIVFPIPVVLAAQIPRGRKVLMVLLFCLGALPVAVTLYRVPAVLRLHGRQSDRTMWASVDIFAAMAAGNAVALGSFIRDTGLKAQRRRPGSRDKHEMLRQEQAERYKVTLMRYKYELKDKAEEARGYGNTTRVIAGRPDASFEALITLKDLEAGITVEAARARALDRPRPARIAGGRRSWEDEDEDEDESWTHSL